MTVPTAAAPVPAWPAAQVKSIYSDAYTFAPASLNSYNEGWWNNPNMTEEAIGEDHYLHYDLYRDGMIGAQMAETSVATMEKFHIDVFASASGSVTFRLICAGDEEAINQTKQTLQLVDKLAGHMGQEQVLAPGVGVGRGVSLWAHRMKNC